MTPTPHLRSAPAATALLIAAFALSGCVEPEAMTCPTGIYCPAGSKCAARQAACIFDDCADGVVQAGEMCDDGNKLDGDGCSADCKSNETCGNTVVDVAMGEVCDDGNNVDSDGCSADCRSVEGCGNGTVDPSEDCDAGPSGVPNVAEETPACDSDCTWARHGDGVVNATAEEQCDGDNGRTCESATCNYDCTPSQHGDGIVNPTDGELCDGDGIGHGNGQNCESETCNANCTPSRCGDGTVNAVAGERCDDGNDSNEDGCLTSCRANTCGDGFRNPAAEQCDLRDRNGRLDCPYGAVSCEVCTESCQLVAGTTHVCRDGHPDPEEECDDGNTSNLDACLTTCQPNTCGDGFRNPAAEQCDRGSSNGQMDCPYGAQSCQVCTRSCEVAAGTRHFCGNDTIDTNVLVLDGEPYSETCDNYISRLVCGTCSNTTCQNVDVRPAVGTITVLTTAVVDGETFSLDNGIANPVTFELNTAGGCAGANQCVNVPADPTTASIANAIKSEIDGLFAASMTVSGPNCPDGIESCTLTLTNTVAGMEGNNRIETSRGSGAIAVTSMTGGVGCPNGKWCSRREDCVSGNCNEDGWCSAP